jgi:DNA-directed RNA polymerase subunit F
LIDRARKLQDQYQNHQDLQIVLEEFRALFDSIKNDPDVVRFQEKAADFFQQFTYVDQSGQRHFNTDLMSELSHVMIPLLLKHLEEIPLPAIEDHTEDLDCRIENITISGYDIIPEHVYFYLNSELDFNLRQLEAEKGRTSALLKVTDIKTKIPGIKFWIKHKTFPHLEDRGVANITIGGEGAGLNIYLTIKNLFSNKPTFAFSRVRFSIDSLRIDIVQTKHSIITPLVSAIWKKKIKHTIEEQVQKKVLTMAQNLETSFNDLLSKYPPPKLSSMAVEKLVSAGETLLGKAQQLKDTLRDKDTNLASKKSTDINQ